LLLILGLVGWVKLQSSSVLVLWSNAKEKAVDLPLVVWVVQLEAVAGLFSTSRSALYTGF
jgi:hypothetical protein